MATGFDIDGTIRDLISAILTGVKQGFETVSALVTSQAKMMAHQAAFIFESSTSGALKDDPVLQQLFADQLADSVRGLARDVAGSTNLTIEKVWNAAVKILWGAINTALANATKGLLVLPAL